ncbi:MAG: hypothetical protein FWE71_08465 [Nocardioidaceae bacterium]|nr:hypothetical protein [Nocardioidaceae bacterium]MCL2613537.1 hypothetical protein [Nocardioidaceae bacterium]
MPQIRALKGVAGTVLALALGLGASACSHHASPKAQGSASASAAPSSVALVSRVDKVSGTGGLPKARRTKIAKQIGSIVDTWWRAAYLSSGGSTRGRKPYAASFTPGATRLAVGDADLLSNAGLGRKVSGGIAKQRRIDLDLLVVKGRVRGVTADLHLVYDTTGGLRQQCVVGGTASLTSVHGRWRIFGYDVNHDCHAPGAVKPTRQAHHKRAAHGKKHGRTGRKGKR